MAGEGGVPDIRIRNALRSRKYHCESFLIGGSDDVYHIMEMLSSAGE